MSDTTRGRQDSDQSVAAAPKPHGPPTPATAPPLRYVLKLQRAAGNQATVQMLTVQRDRRSNVSGDAHTIASYFINAQTSQKREEVLRTLLANHDRAAELRSTYQSDWSRNLDTDLATLDDADALRALDSLDFGELRPMSKALIALGGTGTDTTTLFRVLKDCNRAAPVGTGIERFEAMWRAVVGRLPSGVFDDFRGTLTEALDDDLDGVDLLKAHVILAHGDLRPIDKVYLALNQSGTDEALLFEGLARCNANTVEQDYRNYEHRGIAWSDNASSIWDSLDSELSGEDYRRALALVDREPNPEYGMLFGSSEKTRRLGNNQRLVSLVSAAVHGAGTNMQLILEAIDEATAAEKAELKKKVEDPADPLGLTGFWGDLSSGELAQLRAKLGIAESAADAAGTADSSMLADPTVQLLRGLGGVDRDTVFDKIKLSAGGTWATFKAAYDRNGPFARYVDANTSAPDQAYLQTIFSTNLDTRLNWCFGGFSDDEDYLFHLLGNFASDADRRRLSGDAAFMDKLRSNLSSSEVGRAITLLKPGNLTAQENARWLAQAVERERSGFFDLFSSTGEAVSDENRELQVGTNLALADSSLTPTERRLLAARAGRTQAALTDYTAARDEFANTASMIANVAVSVIIAALTGGAAGPVLVAQLARAAAAMALAKVLTEKVIRGDQFDVFGADGAVAFATGAVDGVMNVAGGLAAKGVMANGLEVVGLSARAAAGSAFRGAARTGLLAATEGTMAGGASGFVDSVARDETWRDGIAEGLERVASSTGTGAAMGAGMSLSIHAALGGVRAIRGNPNENLPLNHADNPLVARANGGDEAALKKIVDRMARWETGIRDIQSGTGIGAGLSEDARRQLVTKLLAHRQNIANHLKAQFTAEPIPGASTEAISDMDLNVKGDNAGRNLIAAEQYMDSAYPGWRAKYRMGLLVDASRIGTVEEMIASLPEAAKVRVRARITQYTATLIFARRLHLASEAERAAMIANPPPGIDVARATALSQLGAEARVQVRNEALLKGDELTGQMRAATDPTVKQNLAEQVTFQQMLANTMDDEAYLSGGGVKGFALGQRLTNVFEQYQALLDQIGMIAHTVHEAGGVLEAARRYELFKYVNRICVLFEQAGIQDERLAFFKNWSELVYRVDREATGALDRSSHELSGGAGRAGVRSDPAGATTAPSDQFLLDNYRRFGEMVEQHGQALGRRAQGDAAGPNAAQGAAANAAPTGAPQLLRLPRPTETDVPGGAASPALPTAIAGDDAALYQRLIRSNKTLEQEIADTEGSSQQNTAARQLRDQVLAKPLRELTPADLAVCRELQQRLFTAAGGAVERMKSFARDMLGAAEAEIISIRKREELDEFVGGILEKCRRKGYQRISEMDDIIRGRLNIENGADVARVAEAMRAQSTYPVTPGGFVAPRVNDAGVIRYPRYHVIVQDPQTGFTHEWQVGTKATSTLYEQRGVAIPEALREAAERLGKHFRNDIHDIEYDVFQTFARREPGVAAELGIPGFIARVAEASQRSAQGAAHTGLAGDIAGLHDEASRLLRALVERKGGDYVAGMFH